MYYFVSAWVFVWVVALFDAGFAWVHRHNFCDWEMNPLALAISRWGGIHGVLGFRLLSVACCCVLITMTQKSQRIIGTSLVALFHLGLAIVYIVILAP